MDWKSICQRLRNLSYEDQCQAVVEDPSIIVGLLAEFENMSSLRERAETNAVRELTRMRDDLLAAQGKQRKAEARVREIEAAIMAQTRLSWGEMLDVVNLEIVPKDRG